MKFVSLKLRFVSFHQKETVAVCEKLTNNYTAQVGGVILEMKSEG